LSTNDTLADRARSRSGGAARFVAPVVAAFLVGGGVVFALQHHSSSSAGTGNAAAALGGSQGVGGPGGGGVAGEQHIQGTVTAKTSSSVTVKSSSGTATYAVNATSEITRNGQTATLAAVQVGDPVLAHVYPASSGQMLVERLFAGTSASDAGPGGLGPPPRSGGTTTTQSGATHI